MRPSAASGATEMALASGPARTTTAMTVAVRHAWSAKPPFASQLSLWFTVIHQNSIVPSASTPIPVISGEAVVRRCTGRGRNMTTASSAPTSSSAARVSVP